MRFEEIVRTSADVAATPSKRAKVERLAACLASARADEVATAVAYLSGMLPQGSIGVGGRRCGTFRRRSTPLPSSRSGRSTTTLRRVGAMSGAGSQTARREALHDLFGRATEPEQRFLRGLLSGEIRQGALEGVMVEAVARASERARRRRAPRGDARRRPRSRRGGGDRSRRRGARPVPSDAALPDPADAGAVGRRRRRRPSSGSRPAAVERKLDGARLQVHRLGDDVRLFTRSLADVTTRAPEIVDAVRALPVGRSSSMRRRSRSEPTGVRSPSACRWAASGAGTRATSSSSAARSRSALRVRRPPPRRRRPPRPAGLGTLRGARRPRPVRDAGAADRDGRRGRRGTLPRGRDRPRTRRRDGEVPRCPVRGRTARRGVDQGEARAHARPRRARRGMGPRATPWMAEQPPPRRARPGGGWLRDAREDLQGHDRRDARVADRAPAGARDAPRRASPCSCAPSSSSRWPSTGCSRARAIRAASPCASLASRDTGPTRRPGDADTIGTVRAIHARAIGGEATP